MMSLYAAGLAASDPIDSISRYFSRTVSPTYYLIGAGVLVAIGIGWWLAARAYQRRAQPVPSNLPGRLFEELCRAHALSSDQRQLLLDMADRAQVVAAALLAAPSLFDRSADDLIALPENNRLELYDLVQGLRAKLFG